MKNSDNIASEITPNNHNSSISKTIKKNFNRENEDYTIIFSPIENSDLVNLKISIEFYEFYYDLNFNSDSLVKENRKWGIYETTDDIVAVILSETDTFQISHTEKELTITLNIDISSGVSSNKKNLVLTLEAKKNDLEMSFYSLSEVVKNIKLSSTSVYEKFASIKSELSEKLISFDGLENTISNLVGKVKTLESELSDIKLHIDKILESNTTQLNEKIRKIETLVEEVKNRDESLEQLVQKVESSHFRYADQVQEDIKRIEKEAQLRLAESQEQCNENFAKSFDKLNAYIDGTVQKSKQVTDLLSNNSLCSRENKITTTFNKFEGSYYTASNGNKTLTRSGGEDGKTFGILCSTCIKFDGSIQKYSVRFDSVNANYRSSIYIGFASSDSSNSDGYINVGQSWLAGMSKKYYNNGDGGSFDILFSNVAIEKDDILTCCLDTQHQEMYVKLNGQVISFKKKMTLDQNLKEKIYPCIDLQYTGFTITLLD